MNVRAVNCFHPNEDYWAEYILKGGIKFVTGSEKTD